MRLGVQAAYVDGEFVPGDVELDDDAIDAVGVSPPGGAGLAVPGFVDLHVHGIAGVDFAVGGDPAAAGHALAATGVTAFQPTLITAAEDDYRVALRRLGEYASPIRMLGVHLEGPFLSPARAGAHDPGLMLPPDPELAGRLLAAGPVRHVTLAPELRGGLELIELLVARGVIVALGHSDADAPTARAAFDRGASVVTHLFNAMPPLHHRAPGLAGAALADPRVTLTVIVDGVHLADETVLLVFAAAAGRVALVTDAIAAAAMPAGDHRLGDRTVHAASGRAELDDGTLAGSLTTMDASVRRLAGLGIAPEAAITAATSTPARLAGRPELGTLRPGTPADVVVLGDDLAVQRTLVGGREAWPRS